eukprot:TRINITY_DN3566_c0_g1_i1.p1 TRINITY_DN3566_c0_g1~~TRINITY_DN3566_c0_g1_i1.p1  ORF type:complete len:168 (-),score=30.11 TRINITY_DN3566_c0_g1_i1:132-635(-)
MRAPLGCSTVRSKVSYNHHLTSTSKNHTFFCSFLLDQMENLTGALALARFLDKRVVLEQASGEIIHGIFRSFDHYGNIVLQKSSERILHGEEYVDVPLGFYFVRAGSVVTIGEIDEEKEENLLSSLKLNPGANPSKWKEAQRKASEEKKERIQSARKRLGFPPELQD